LKQDTAKKVFREGAYHNDQGAGEAIKKLVVGQFEFNGTEALI
jgi:hypothetical protein